MSVIDFMILGILKYKPLNPYEIVRVIDEYKINKWIKIPAPSVYQNLKKMSKKGYLSSVVEKDGEMPEKTIYSVNENGEEYFMKLAVQNSENPAKVYENFLPFISNLVHIDKKTGENLIKKLRLTFINEKSEVDFYINKLAIGSTLYDKALLNYYEKVLSAKIEWIDELFDEYVKDGFGYPK